MAKFKRGDIKYWTDPNSYTRGRQYFDQGKVNSLYVEQLDDDEIMLHTSVHGRDSSPYKQQINIEGLATGVIEIAGSCSCPVGYNCKHVVAACLEYHARAEPKKNGSSSSSLFWLDNFVKAGQPPAKPDPHDPSRAEFIAYILQPSALANVLSVQFITTRYLKKGGLSKGRLINLYDFSNEYARPAYARDCDREIAQLIDMQNNNWQSHRHNISGEAGFLALSKMLNTSRCYWQDTNKPLRQSTQTRQLQLNWSLEKNSDFRLAISVQPHAMVLDTWPALYIDTQEALIGNIQGADFNAEQWTMLLQTPAVPTAASSEFSQQLLLRIPDLPLPPPLEMETVIVKQQTPVAQLRLYAQPHQQSTQPIHSMCLRFQYADHEISYLPISQVRKQIENNHIVSIERDLQNEQTALQVLLDAGFQLSPDPQQADLILTTSSDSKQMDTALCWQNFLQTVVPELETQGWNVIFDAAFKMQFLEVENWHVDIDSDNDWFDLRFDLDVQGHKLPLLPLITEIMNNYDLNNMPEMLLLPLSIGDNQYLQLPYDRIRPICQILYELYDSSSLDKDGSMRLSRLDATRLAELEENCHNELHWRGGKAMRQLGRKLKNFDGIKKIAVPRGLKAELRDYQQQGFNWLQFLRDYEFNGILADDMGLGKTVQTLAHLLKEKESKRMDIPCLILAPTSLMSNWRREVEKFTPKLRVLILQGPQRHQYFNEINQHDLIISTYPLLVRDQKILLAQQYHYLILDEAQLIKNPRAKAAQVAREVNARHRLCLTGTPMENHLGELWALFDFLMPGFLGDSKLFKQRFRTPIEKHGDSEQGQRLVRRVAPFLLRRNKAEVVSELPAKTEIIRSVSLGSKQAALYESIRLAMEKKVRDAIAQKGLARSHITILDALLKLRQVCCDPQLLSLTHAKKIKESAKLDMLMEMLTELLEEGRRILLFSQFTKMLAIIEQKLIDNRIRYCKLTGQTRKRDEVIESFRNGEAEVFLISLKAGGVGLNLTEADTVIHYDPWWNPAVENQATDRAHRIGQNKAVFVYKLITENTLEEKIMAMQASKQALADGVYNNSQQNEKHRLNATDLQELFSPLTTR